MINDLSKKIIFKKYKVLKLIKKGSFGFVFEAKNILTNELVALKAEDWKIKGNCLESEAYFLFYLKGFGIPEIRSFGSYKRYKILIQTLLGKNLDNLFSNILYKTNLKDICMIAIQLLDRLEYIHSKYVIHRDLKPDNILVDLETKSIIYLIDFGLAKKYRSGKTKKHIKFSLIKKLNGTIRYCSTNANIGGEQSRRDDLESAGYILIYLAKKKYLPWMGLNISNTKQLLQHIYNIKKKIKEEVLCQNLPKEFCDYLKYVKNLEFEEDPDYNYIRSLFLNILESMQYKYDLKFSWNFKFKQNLNKSSSSNDIKFNLISKKKESSHMRILKHIQNIQEKENNNNIKGNKLDNINNDINGKRIEKNENIEIAELIKEKFDLKNYKTQSDKFDEKNEKDNNNDNWSKIAQFNMDIIIDDSNEEKLNNHNKKNKINSNIDKINIPKFNVKKYKINYKYTSVIKKSKEDKRNKIFLTENSSFKKLDVHNMISKDIALDVNHYKNKRINQSNNLDSLYFKPEIISKSQKMNIINNNLQSSNQKRINLFNNAFQNKMKNIITGYNTKNELSYNKKRNPKQLKIKNYKNIFSRKNMSLKNIITNNNKLIFRKYENQILKSKTNINKKENNIESYGHKGNLIRNKSEKQYNFISMSSKNKKIKSRNNETFNDKNIYFIYSGYQSVIKKHILKNSIQLTKVKEEKDKILKSGIMSNSVENIFQFLEKRKNKLFQNNIEGKKKFIYVSPKNVKIHKKNLSQINNTYSNINIENNFIFPINNYSNYRKIIPLNINNFPDKTNIH